MVDNQEYIDQMIVDDGRIYTGHTYNYKKLITDYISTNKTLKSYIFTKNVYKQIVGINSVSLTTSFHSSNNLPIPTATGNTVDTAESYFDDYLERVKRDLTKVKTIPRGETLYNHNLVPQSLFNHVMQSLRNYAFTKYEQNLALAIEERELERRIEQDAQNEHLELEIMKSDGSLLPPGWEFHRYQPEDDDEEEACQICQDDFEEGDEMMVHNGMHKFHPECASRWVNGIDDRGRHKRCPTCRGFGKRTSRNKIRGLRRVNIRRRSKKNY